MTNKFELFLRMKNTQLNSVIRLVRRTGDRVVIMDNESEEVMVLMNMNSYENLLDNNQNIEKMTEEQLLEKINRDIAVWRAYNESEESYDNDEHDEINPLGKIIQEKSIAEELEPENTSKIIEKNIADVGPLENEEPLSDDISEDEGEEKFYLEPVE